jgi:hypothetical protein
VYLRRRKEFDLGLVSDLGLKEFRDGRRVDDRKLDVIERPLPIDARRLDTDASTMLPNNGSSHCRSLKGLREARDGLQNNPNPGAPFCLSEATASRKL